MIEVVAVLETDVAELLTPGASSAPYSVPEPDSSLAGTLEIRSVVPGTVVAVAVRGSSVDVVASVIVGCSVDVDGSSDVVGAPALVVEVTVVGVLVKPAAVVVLGETRWVLVAVVGALSQRPQLAGQ